MTEIVDNFIDITYEIKASQPNLLPNQTNSELILQVLSNNSLLQTLANQTNLTAEYINQTVWSVYASSKNILAVYEYYKELQTREDNFNDLNSALVNSTDCGGRLDNTNLTIVSFVPALIIIVILSCVNKRIWRRGYCGGRPGLAIPVNLLDSYEDRFTYAFAFAATASRIINVILDGDFTQVFGEDFREVHETLPGWANALLRILASLIIGVSYYPFFACISTHQRTMGAVLGTIYSTIWFLSSLFKLVDCKDDPNATYTRVELIFLQGTTILFHGVLVLAFLRVLVMSLISKRRGMVVSKEEWKENYSYQYVKTLLKRIPASSVTVIEENGLKQKVASNVYRWKPDFKYSSRIICIYMTGCACLYLVIVNYIALSRFLKDFTESFVDSLEENEQQSLLPRKSETDWDRIREGIGVTIICWLVAVGIATIKDFIMVGNMLSWYRGHRCRLQRGDRYFLPYNMDVQNPVDIMVASFKFAGYQAGYIIWSFIVTQIVLFLVITVVVVVFIWPLTWGKSFDTTVLRYVLITFGPTMFITLITILVQRLMAKFLFLQNNGSMLALNNRRLFHIASYFLFFLNIFVGLVSCLIRIVYAILFGALFLPRLQKSALPRDWELFDPGYKAYIGYLFLEHTHTNPILFVFNRLMREGIENNDENETESKELDIESVHEVVPIPRRARNRWFVAVTLINNPSLQTFRKPEQVEEEEKKENCTIKNIKVKVARKIDAIRESHSNSIESKL